MARNKSRARIMQEMRIENDRMRRALNDDRRYIEHLFDVGILPNPLENKERRTLIAHAVIDADVPKEHQMETLVQAMARELLKVVEFKKDMTSRITATVPPYNRVLLQAKVQVLVEKDTVSEKDCSS